MAHRRQRESSGSAPIVYSTEHGRLCRNCGQRIARCRCRFKAHDTPSPTASDGKVRVRRETKGRKGKTVTTVSGVPVGLEELRELAGELKRLCGSGGGVKDGVIEIQGDHAERLVAVLCEKGYRAIRAGG